MRPNAKLSSPSMDVYVLHEPTEYLLFYVFMVPFFLVGILLLRELNPIAVLWYGFLLFIAFDMSKTLLLKVDRLRGRIVVERSRAGAPRTTTVNESLRDIDGLRYVGDDEVCKLDLLMRDGRILDVDASLPQGDAVALAGTLAHSLRLQIELT